MNISHSSFIKFMPMFSLSNSCVCDQNLFQMEFSPPFHFQIVQCECGEINLIFLHCSCILQLWRAYLSALTVRVVGGPHPLSNSIFVTGDSRELIMDCDLRKPFPP